MAKGAGSRVLRRGLADFLLVFALFWALAAAIGVNQDKAFAVQLPTDINHAIMRDVAGPNPASFHVPGTTAMYLPQEDPAQRLRNLLLLSFAVAGMAAFNLAFWRHLRRAYASPRRSVWRRVTD
jgi:hypothetical protein